MSREAMIIHGFYEADSIPQEWVGNPAAFDEFIRGLDMWLVEAYGETGGYYVVSYEEVPDDE